jgi:hypothetical protein
MNIVIDVNSTQDLCDLLERNKEHQGEKVCFSHAAVAGAIFDRGTWS